MDLAELFNESPFMQLLGMEVTVAEGGHAEGRLPMDEQLYSSNFGSVLHGGGTYALADTVGGAAVVSLAEAVCPTVNMRIDYLSPVTDDIHAEAEVIRDGSSIAVAHVEVHDSSETRVATAQGTYKTDGQGNATPWSGDAADGSGGGSDGGS